MKRKIAKTHFMLVDIPRQYRLLFLRSLSPRCHVVAMMAVGAGQGCQILGIQFGALVINLNILDIFGNTEPRASNSAVFGLRSMSNG